jgi:hypothetical protein
MFLVKPGGPMEGGGMAADKAPPLVLDRRPRLFLTFSDSLWPTVVATIVCSLDTSML